MLNDEQLKYKEIIGWSTILTNKQIKTVVNKVSEINDVYRTTPIQLIAGEDNFQVQIKHCGVNLQFNYKNVYWNTRLDNAHQDVINYCIKNIQQDHYVLDLTCGVGPFSVPLIKQNVNVISNDLNPEAIKYLKINSKKWYNKIQIHNEDEQQKQIIDVVIVNLPELSIDLIENCSKQNYQKPTFILECFSNENEYVQQSLILRLIASQYGWNTLTNELSIKVNKQDDFELLKHHPQLNDKINDLKNKYFNQFQAEIVRDVSPSKNYCKIICQFKNQFQSD